MKKLLKILLIIVLVILALIGAVVACTGVMVTKGVQQIAKDAMDAGPQTITDTADGVAVTTTLKENKGAILQGVDMCELSGAPKLSQTHSTVCANDECKTTITFEGAVPPEVTVTRKFQGNCVTQTIPQIERYVRVIGYEASVKFDEATLDRLDISKEDRTNMVKTPQSKFSGSAMLSLGSDVKFTLDYSSARPVQDEFRLGSKLVTVKYNDAAPTSVAR